MLTLPSSYILDLENINFMLLLTYIIFVIGIIGIVLNRKNLLVSIMSLEILLLSVNLNFALFSNYLDDLVGQVFILFVLTVAATESATGLAVITNLYNLKNYINYEPLKKKINKGQEKYYSITFENDGT